MTAQELATMLREGGADEATVTALVNNAAFQAKAQQLARQAEVDQFRQQATQVQSEYEKARQYQDWYDRNYAAVIAQNAEVQRYRERFGQLDNNGNQPNNQPPPQNGRAYTDAEIKAMVDARLTEAMNTNYGKQFTQSLVQSNKIVERHVRSGRTSPIDWDKVTELAVANGGNVEAAYEAWDKPEADKAAEAAYKAKLKAEVDQEVEKRMLAMAGQGFPAGADISSAPSPLAARGADVKYDRQSVLDAANSVLRAPDYRPGFGKAN